MTRSKRPEGRAPVHPQRLVIRASAGTGKTFQLSNRYLTLLRSVSPEKILATTFTRKAAGEILQRILLRLAEGGLSEEAARGMSIFLGDPPVTKAECLNLLMSLTRQLHRVQVSTIDSFFSKLAAVASLELGLSPGWRLLDEVELGVLRDEAIEQVLREGDHRDLMRLVHMLDKGNRRSGVHRLISSKVDAFYDLYCRAPEEAWEQFPAPRFLTDAQRADLIEEIVALELSPTIQKAVQEDLVRFAGGDWKQIAGTGLCAKILANESNYKRNTIPESLIRLYRRLLDHFASVELVAWAEQTLATRHLMERYHVALEERKREARGLYFSDVTRLLARALSGTSVNLKLRLDGNIEHLLLDEFQDTSVDQWAVLRPVALSTCQDSSGSFFCVGDEKQAIYGWRQGESSLLRNLSRDLPDITEQRLSRSFRSSRVIMDFVNLVFTGLAKHPGLGEQEQTVREWLSGFPQHETTLTDLSGYVVLRTSPLPPDCDAPGRRTSELDAETRRFSATYIAELQKKVPGETIGILVRKKETIANLIFELGRAGVAASEEGGSPLTDSAAVDTILSLMRLTDHPGDTAARFHVARSPLGEVLGYSDHENEEETYDLVMRMRRQLLRDGYGKTVHQLTTRLAPACSLRELRRLNQLASLSDTYDRHRTLRTMDFVNYVEQTGVQEATASYVRVMTLHAAKGLEFDHVILPELDADIWKVTEYVTGSSSPVSPPETIAIYKGAELVAVAPANLQEAFRQTKARSWNDSLSLLYVALTRAVRSLHILVRPTKAKDVPAANTLADLLRTAVASTVEPAADKVLFELGDSDWYQQQAKEKTKPVVVDQQRGEQVTAPLAMRLGQTGGRPGRSLTRVLPSEKSPNRLVTLATFLPVEATVAMERGTVFHRWLEEIRWLNEEQPGEERLGALARELGVGEVQIDRWLGEFRKMLTSPAIFEILSSEAYGSGHVPGLSEVVRQEMATGGVELDVLRERRFSIERQGQLISGSMDRVVLFKQGEKVIGADILDFKTDSADVGEEVLAERMAQHGRQLRVYCEAAQQIFGMGSERISARVVLLSAGKVEPVQE